MTVAGLPDRETLLIWMSAFLDGELPSEDEAILLQAMEADPELLAIFDNLSAAYEPATNARTGLSEADAHDLTHNILLAVAPAALPDPSPELGKTDDAHVLQWASVAADNALDERSAKLLAQACEAPQTAQKIVAFVENQEKVGAFLSQWPERSEMKEMLAPMEARVADGIRMAEERQMAWSAAIDGESAADDSLSISSESEAQEALAFARSSEAIGTALRHAIDDPAAQRAGAAALQVIAAHAAQAADEKSAQQATEASASAQPASSGLGWRRFFPIAGFASAALALTIWASNTSPSATVAQTEEPKVALVEEPTEAWEPLSDNTAQVESLDSGSHVAAVFATDASQITVIWVAEPEDEPQTETGT